MMGQKYRYGTGIEKNQVKAVRYFRMAAEHGSALGEEWLGTMYATGLGVQLDETEAFKWFLRAAKQSRRRARHEVAARYKYGNGVEQNEKESLFWYGKLLSWYSGWAERGDAFSMLRIAEMYKYGDGVSKSMTESMEWYLRAAKEGDAEAQARVAYQYFDGGEWVEKDLIEAYAWGFLSADNDGRSGKSIIKMMGHLLTDAEKEKAIARSENLLEE